MYFLFFLISFLYQVNAMEQAFDKDKFLEEVHNAAKLFPKYERPEIVQKAVFEWIKIESNLKKEEIDKNDKNLLVSKMQETKDNLNYYKSIAAGTLSILTGEEGKTLEEQRVFINDFYSGKRTISNPLLKRIDAVLQYKEINAELQNVLKKVDILCLTKDEQINTESQNILKELLEKKLIENDEGIETELKKVEENVLRRVKKEIIRGMSASERIICLAFETLKLVNDKNYYYSYGKETDFWVIAGNCGIKILAEIPSSLHALLLADVYELGAAQYSSINLYRHDFLTLLSEHSVDEATEIEKKDSLAIHNYMYPLSYVNPRYCYFPQLFPMEFYGYSSLKE
ncbi:MAG: hypothetical protein ACTSXG_04420 [Alphaproteobacteria bacterium]